VTEQIKADALVPAAATAGGPRFLRFLCLSSLSSLAGRLRSGLFRPPEETRVGWRGVVLAVVFLAAGTTASLLRTRGPGSLNTIWIEDANNFLQDALHQSVLTTLTTQMNGYYDLVPRAVTAVAVTFPLAWAPGIMAACGALQYALVGLLAYIASRPYLRSRWLRLLVAAPVSVMPLGYTQVNNDLATVQFIGLYGMFWLLIWRPVTLAGRITAPVVMLCVTLSSILPLLLAPLVALRLIADRSKTSIAVAVCWAAGLIAQWTLQVRGMSNRSAQLFTSPLWILGNYVTRVVPRAIFGELALGGPGTNGEGHPIPLRISDMAVHDALIWGACAIVVFVVVIALAGLTAPHWPLTITALLFSVLLFLGEIIDNLPIVQPRYVIAPALLLYTAIVAMLRPRGLAAGPPVPGATDGQPDADADEVATAASSGPRRTVATWTPVALFALLLAVVCGFNFRVTNNRSESPPWTAIVAAASHRCLKPGMADYDYRHAWWQLKIPCSRVDAS
jgi:hypothetical protein